MRSLPFHRRFGFTAFLFCALLLACVIAPTARILDLDYARLADRIEHHVALFEHCADRLAGLGEADWPAAIESFPRVFDRQRICVFGLDKELVYDSGSMREGGGGGAGALEPIFPDPYIDWAAAGDGFDPAPYLRALRSVDLAALDPARDYRATLNVRYAAGMDRVVVAGRLLRPAGGRALILTMGHSVVDVLVQGRAVKERLLILYSLVFLLCALSAAALGRSVVGPLERLYGYSRDILASRGRGVGPAPGPAGAMIGGLGEIGEACRALGVLVDAQRRRSELFESFSSDLAHELKSPLSALRSGLETYAESGDEGERRAIYARLNRVIQRMEALMDEMRLLGSAEAGAGAEGCDEIAAVVEEALCELGGAGVRVEIAPEARSCRVAVSGEQLYRIIVNLLRNATSFSPARGSISLSLRIEGGCLALRVGDGGPGIPEEVFPRIAERFFSYRPGDGEPHSGLGLSMVDAILRGRGGRLDYRNKPEGGAEFTCLVPIAASRGAPGPCEPSGRP